MQPTDEDAQKPAADTEADGYMENENMGSDDLDLSFLDEDEPADQK